MQDGIDKIQGHDSGQRSWASIHFQPGSSCVCGRDVDGDQLDGPAHLRRGQAYASLGQGFLHIVQEGKDIPVDMNHGPAFLSQKRMSVLKNIKNHGRQDDMDKRV